MTTDDIHNDDLDLRASLLSAFLCVLFGANSVAIKISLSGIEPFANAGIRFSLAAVFIFFWAVGTKRPTRLPRDQLGPLLIIALIFAGQLSLFYLGLSRSNASRGSLLANLQPFFILFLAHFFIPGDQITLRKLLGIVLGFSGVACVFLDKQIGSAGDLRIGDMIILVATFLWALNAVYIKRVIHRFEPYQIVMYQMIFAVPLFIIGAFLWDRPMFFHPDTKVLGALLYQSVVTAAFGFLAWIHLLQRYGTVALHSFVFIMPIAGVVLGGMILNEPITGKILLALGFIVSGIFIIHFKTKKRIIPITFYKG